MKKTKTFLEEAAFKTPRFYAITRINGNYSLLTLDLQKETLSIAEEDLFSLSCFKLTKEIRKDLEL